MAYPPLGDKAAAETSLGVAACPALARMHEKRFHVSALAGSGRNKAE